MNRTKLMQAVMNVARGMDPAAIEAVKSLSDINLLAFAIQIGIDTDSILGA